MQIITSASQFFRFPQRRRSLDSEEEETNNMSVFLLGAVEDWDAQRKILSFEENVCCFDLKDG
jgi:hypothetical protein